MTLVEISGLSALRRTVIMRAGFMLATFALLCLFAESAAAQQPPQEKRDELDVTMQIIVDPDAKLPDEVVRRIPLPARKPDAPSGPGAGNSGNSSEKKSDGGKPESAGSDQDRDAASEAREHGKETSQAAKERAREAADQREQARRVEAEERRRERGPPDDRPDPPNRPPRN
jgi:hypothetical protein